MSEENQLPNGTSADGAMGEFEALQAVVTALRSLDQEARHRILESAATFLGISPASEHGRSIHGLISTGPSAPSGGFASRAPFSEDTSMSPKDFLMEKAPKTDVERIACLAYYLTHYKATPHFKTLDLSQLNTDAAQPKFSNAGYSANNALKLGYIVSSTKGHRQLSALGERFVQALPDRNAAKELLVSLRRRSRSKRKRASAELEGD